MRISTEKTFSTSSLYQAAFLIACGIRFLRKETDSTGKADFVFEDNVSIVELVEQFSNRSTEVRLWPFIEAQKFLKSVLYD